MKKSVLGIMLLLFVVGIGVSGLALRIHPTKADPEAQLSLETDKDGYIWLWENVTITLTNIGNETVEIEGYPAWQVFTYPEGEPVYPSNYSTSLWSLAPGEKDTFTWNQYNNFTKKYVLPGTYVVRDTQGWGLSAYLQINWWVHYVPHPEQVDLTLWMMNETVYIDVTITYPVIALDVADWGVVVRNGSDIWVDSEVWKLISDWYLQMVQVFSFTYDLGHLEPGNYAFTFSVWGAPVESIHFTIGLAGDLNFDGIVDIKDMVLAAMAFGSYPGHPAWNPIADVNSDGTVDIKDLVAIALHFGETYT